MIQASAVPSGAEAETGLGAGVGGTTDNGKDAAGRGESTVVFGGFACGGQWKNAGRVFSGDGRSFLFSFDGRNGGNGSAAEEETRRVTHMSGGRGGGNLRVYTWAGSDRSFMTSQDGVGLGMGGGGDEGNFGFFLESDLRRGSTGRCETFGNEPLVSGGAGGGSAAREGAADVPAATGGVFEVLSVEVWGFRASKPGEGLARVEL